MYVHLYEAGHETFNEIYLKSLLLYRGNFQHANQEWRLLFRMQIYIRIVQWGIICVMGCEYLWPSIFSIFISLFGKFFFVYPLYMYIRYRVIRCHVISINSWSCNLKGNEVYNVHYHRRSPYPCPTVKGKRTVRFVTKSNASGDDKRGNVTDGISSGD